MDFERVNEDLLTKEFLAVILAGYGDGLAPLTSDYGEMPSPKSLLPIANKPLIDHVLLWLEQSGIKDVLLICPTRHRSSIYHHIHSNLSPSSLSIDLQTFDDGEDENDGTCGLLRHFSHRISEDFVIVPCDFIPPPTLPLSLLLNKFRVEASSKDHLVMTCWYTSQSPDKASFIEEWGPPSVTFPILWDENSATLLHIDTPDEQDKNPDDVELRMSMLSMFPRTTMSTALEDSHVYVCKRSVLELLNENPSFSSLREEFLPWLCKLQYRHLIPACPNVGIVIHDKPAMRINTLQNFYEINKRILNGATYSIPADRSLIDQKAQISADSIIGESTQISERTTIKKSVIGRHCIVGKMVKINSCVLLDHCVIEEGAKLESCILGKNTQVGNKAELIRCVTQGGYEVGSGEIIKGEKLEVSNWMATPDEIDGLSD